MYNNQEPQQQGTRVMQHNLEEIKAVQERIKRNMAHLTELKVESKEFALLQTEPMTSSNIYMKLHLNTYFMCCTYESKDPLSCHQSYWVCSTPL